MRVTAMNKDVILADYTPSSTSTWTNYSTYKSYEGLLDRYIPKEDHRARRRIYNDIYYYDAICGSAIDMIAVMPFSDFEITETGDDSITKIYMDSMKELKIHTLITELAADYLIEGLFVGSLLFNSDFGTFTDVIPHNLDNLDINPIPIYDREPKIDVIVPSEFKNFLTSTDKRDLEARKEIPKSLLKLYEGSKVPLDSISTLYIPRKTRTSTYRGVSFLERILPLHLIERALLHGTIIGANKRQRSTFHILMGDEDWIPSKEEMQAITAAFMEADEDPTGAIVSTRKGIETNEVRSGQDFWKLSEEYDFLTAAKLKAMGISEAFLAGEVSYNSAENAASAFVESLRSFRYVITQRVFYQKLFPLIAMANDIYVPNASSKNGIRTKDREYLIPEIRWHNQLRPESDSEYFDMLEKAAEKGIPIPLKYFAAATGLSLEKILESKDDDIKLREETKKYKDEVAKIGGEGEEGEGGEDDLDENWDATSTIKNHASKRRFKHKKHNYKVYAERQEQVNESLEKVGNNIIDIFRKSDIRKNNVIRKFHDEVIPNKGVFNSKYTLYSGK